MSRDVSIDNPPVHRVDNPVVDPNDDEFNRSPFSERLAETIAGFDTSAGSPVLGLFGKWGFGKSTILNFLKDELKKKQADKIKIFEFNPWLFKDQDSLLKEFFNGLVGTIEQSLGEREREVGKILIKYGGALSAIPVLGSGLKEVAKAVGEDLAKDTVQSLRAGVIKIMRGSTYTIVVLIDDLDRLDRDDIMTILKLVRLSANFPHVIYVLAFDDEMVAKAAGEKYGGGAESGRQFLEKIIQYPFSLPAIRPDRLVEFVLRRAQEACVFAGITLSSDDWEVFRGLVSETLSTRLGTPRQAIRYANALRFALPMLKDEVDPLTQMMVEGLRTFFPELYTFARERYGSIRNDRAKVEEGIKEAMVGASKRHVDAGSRILLDLTARSVDKPVFDPRYFDRYFSYTVSPEDISERDVHNFLEMVAEDNPDLAGELLRLAKTNPLQLLKSVEERASRLGLEQGARLARLLATEGLVFVTPGESVLKSTIASNLAKLVRQAFLAGRRSLKTPESLELAAEVIRQANPLPLAVLFLEALYQGFSKGMPKDKLPSGTIQKLHLELCTRIQRSAELKPLYLTFPPYDALRLLKEWRVCKPDGPATWLNARIQEHPDEVGPLLELFLSTDGSYEEVTKMVNPDVLSRIVTDQLALEDQRLAGKVRLRRSWIDVGRQFLSEHSEHKRSADSEIRNSSSE